MVIITSLLTTPPQLVVPVEVEGRRVCEVRVREQAPIITVMFKVAQVSGVTLTINSALFELSESLRIRKYDSAIIFPVLL